MFNETTYLQKIIEREAKTTLYLMNGVQLHGTILDADQETILFYCEGTNQMIYKHAISTVKTKNV